MTDSPQAARVLIIDDHPLFRRGVRQLLAMDDSFEIVGEAAGGQEGIELTRLHDPDLILLDLNMKGINGLETLRTLRDMGCDSRIVMLTVSNAPEDLMTAIRAGADGYVLKDNDPEEILRMIVEVMHGVTVISPELASQLAGALREESLSDNRSQVGLTERENAILKCLAVGMSNKLIARELDLSVETVKDHVAAVLRALGVSTRTQAVLAVSQMTQGRAGIVPTRLSPNA